MIRGLLVCAVLGTAISASAQPRPATPPSAFDATGWTFIGAQTVEGRHDRDTVWVGKYEGKYDQITMVVTDSDIELKELTIFFGNGEKWSPPNLRHVFKEGQRSRAIDLPGNERTITKIELRYANLPGGGKARVSLYGRDTRLKKPPAFDPKGWLLLGTQTVDGRRDRDTITVGRYEGRFDELTMVVSDSDLELRDFTVVFGNGERFSPHLKHVFKEGQRSRAIDLPGDTRTIAKIELAYANLPGGGKARVEIYGRNKKLPGPLPPPAPPPAPTFDPTGWTLLGTGVVNGARDHDSIKVGAYKGGYDQLTMLVNDSDLELNDMTIVFANGEKWSPRLKHFFKEGQRSHAIDLPGKDRQIRRIDLAYANLPGGGKARIQIFGRDVGRPAPPPLTPLHWENKGWMFLGKRTVDGWRDRDRLMITAGKPFSELTFVVVGSDVQINNIVVTFGNGEKFEMNQPMVFKEGTRTTPVDLPGKLRRLKSVEFTYQNLPGGGRASVEVWGRTKPNATPPLPPNGNPGPLPPQPPPPGPDVRDHRQ